MACLRRAERHAPTGGSVGGYHGGGRWRRESGWAGCSGGGGIWPQTRFSHGQSLPPGKEWFLQVVTHAPPGVRSNQYPQAANPKPSTPVWLEHAGGARTQEEEVRRHTHHWALDGGVLQCPVSILRNGNVACPCHIFPIMSHVEF